MWLYHNGNFVLDKKHPLSDWSGERNKLFEEAGYTRFTHLGGELGCIEIWRRAATRDTGNKFVLILNGNSTGSENISFLCLPDLLDFMRLYGASWMNIHTCEMLTKDVNVPYLVKELIDFFERENAI